MNKYRWYPVAFFLATALLVTLPLFFKSGYVLLLDWAPVPHESFQATWTDVGIPIRVLIWMMTSSFASGIGQKLFLTVLIFLAGYGGYRMASARSVWVRVIIGLFFQFNPFIYSRMLTGQLGHIIAFVLLPWVICVAGLWFDRMTWRQSVFLGASLTLVLWPSSHLGMMMVLTLVVLAIAWCVRQIVRKRFVEDGASFPKWRTVFARGTIVCIVFVVLNANWLLPFALGHPGQDVEYARSAVTNEDILSFFTRTDPDHGALWNVAAMYGFWGDDEWRYVPQKAIVPYWFHLLWALLALVAWGFIVAVMPKRWKRDNGSFRRVPSHSKGARAEQVGGDTFLRSRAAAIAMALVGGVAFVAAVGVAHPWFKPSMFWMYDHVPFARGFREPQKFVALLVLVYAFFAARGIDDLFARIERLRRKRWWWLQLITPGLFFIIPIAYSPGLIWGFRGQLQPRQYPESWFTVDRYLAEDQDDFRAVFLPWHQYINLSFAGTVVVNPAGRFFHSHPVLAGDNIEFGSIYSTSTRPESSAIEAMIRQPPPPHSWEAAMTLARLNVKYVLLLEESDFMQYTWIERAGGFTKLLQEDHLRVYRNEAWMDASERL